MDRKSRESFMAAIVSVAAPGGQALNSFTTRRNFHVQGQAFPCNLYSKALLLLSWTAEVREEAPGKPVSARAATSN